MLISPLTQNANINFCNEQGGGGGGGTVVFSPVREIIHSLKIVDYLIEQADKRWYNFYKKLFIYEIWSALQDILLSFEFLCQE